MKLVQQLLCLTALLFLLAAHESPAFAARWQFGDTHVHDDHSSDGSLWRQLFGQAMPGDLSVAQQINEAEHLDLNFLPLTDHRTYDQYYDPEWVSLTLLMVPGEEANGSPHATVQGAVDTIVQGAHPPGSADFRVVQQSIWDAHAQDAVWNTAHPDDGEMNDDHSPNIYANAEGIDNIETWNRASDPGLEIEYAENRWNQGYRTGITGASDDHFKQVWQFAGPGMPSTGVYANDTTVRAVLDGLRAGTTTLRARATAQAGVPTAELTALSVNNSGAMLETLAGEELIAAAGTPVRLKIHVRDGFGSTVYVYQSPGRNAGAYAVFHPTAPLLDAEYTLDVQAHSTPTWYRVEVRGPGLGPGPSVESEPGPSAHDASALLSGVKAENPLPYRRHALHALTPPLFIDPAPQEATPDIALLVDQGQTDGAVMAIGDIGHFSGFPDIATAGTLIHVVAESHDGQGHSQVQYRRQNGGGEWSTPIPLSGISPTARFPKIAARGHDVWVTWQDERAGEIPHRSEIYLRHSANGGLSWDAETVVRAMHDPLGGRAEHPVIALMTTGQPILAWQEIRANSAFDIYSQIIGLETQPTNLSADGKTVQHAHVQDSRSARFPASVWPSIAVNSDGQILIAWQDNRTDLDPLWTGGAGYGNGTNPDNWQIMLRSRSGAKTAWSASLSLGADDHADRHPSVVATADGQWVIAWDSRVLSPAGVNLAILAASSRDGLSWTTPQSVGLDADAMSQWPKLGLDSNGQALLTWFDTRSSDWRWRIALATRDTSGTWSEASLINSLGNNTWPAVSNGALAFASTRNARRMQRDRTQQIMLLRPGEY